MRHGKERVVRGKGGVRYNAELAVTGILALTVLALDILSIFYFDERTLPWSKSRIALTIVIGLLSLFVFVVHVVLDVIDQLRPEVMPDEADVAANLEAIRKAPPPDRQNPEDSPKTED